MLRRGKEDTGCGLRCRTQPRRARMLSRAKKHQRQPAFMWRRLNAIIHAETEAQTGNDDDTTSATYGNRGTGSRFSRDRARRTWRRHRRAVSQSLPQRATARPADRVHDRAFMCDGQRTPPTAFTLSSTTRPSPPSERSGLVTGRGLWFPENLPTDASWHDPRDGPETTPRSRRCPC